MMNRSAKAEARSSLHYGGEGVLTHSAYQGVCGWHGAEGVDVTQGGLGGSSQQGWERARAISDERSALVCPSSRRRMARYLKLRNHKLSDRKGGWDAPGRPSVRNRRCEGRQ